MKTTLNQIRKKLPCSTGWKKLLAHLGETQADDEPLSIITVLDSNGLDDALWCLRAVKGRDREIRLFGVWCARQVQHLMRDARSIDALDVAERFANGEATDRELDATRAAARAATRAATGPATGPATRDSAGAAARAATGPATGPATRAAARAAAGAAAQDELRDELRPAAWEAAGAAARDAQANRLRELCAECDAEEVAA